MPGGLTSMSNLALETVRRTLMLQLESRRTWCSTKLGTYHADTSTLEPSFKLINEAFAYLCL